MYQAYFKKMPVHVDGEQLRQGDAAPDFSATRQDLSAFGFSEIKGPCIISTVPSLDTGVCSLQTARFHKEAEARPGLSVLTLSLDLPFAQQRWCQGVSSNPNFIVLSDYRDREFCQKYGLLIREYSLAARAVFAIDGGKIVRHAQYCANMSEEPDYEAALGALL